MPCKEDTDWNPSCETSVVCQSQFTLLDNAQDITKRRMVQSLAE